MMYQVFLSILETFIAFGFGALAWRLGMVRASDLGRLSRLTLDMFFPMLTFATITETFNPDALDELWQMPLAGFGLMLAGAGVGFFVKSHLRNHSPERERTFHHICAINNYVFLPIIVLQNVWGERHVALLLLMNVGSTIGFWTVGVMTLTGHASWRGVIRSIFSINVAAVAAALLVSFCGIPVPEALEKTFSTLGGIAVPLMLVLTGVALVRCVRGILSDWNDMLRVTLVRLIFIPVILVLFLRLLPLSTEVFQTLAVVALMPAAASSVLVAGRYGGDAEFAGQSIVVTTLCSLVTMPLLMHWLVF